jgi:hypothetical protein
MTGFCRTDRIVADKADVHPKLCLGWCLAKLGIPMLFSHGIWFDRLKRSILPRENGEN